MAKTALITVMALIASVTAEPYIYGAPLYAPSAALSEVYTAPELATGIPAAYPAGYPAVYAASYPAGYPAGYATYPAAYASTYPGAYAAGYPVPALSAVGSSYRVDETARLVNTAPAPLLSVFGSALPGAWR